MRIAYAVYRDARLSWGGLPAPGRGLSSVRPDACHLILRAVVMITAAARGLGRVPIELCAAVDRVRRQADVYELARTCR
jgi:hypothetical protein